MVTRGDQGSLLLRGGLGSVALESDRCEVPAVEAERAVDPTGCGDSYRAGLLHALHEGLPLEVGARLGSLLGALKVAQPGPQSIPLEPGAFAARYEQEFGERF